MYLQSFLIIIINWNNQMTIDKHFKVSKSSLFSDLWIILSDKHRLTKILDNDIVSINNFFLFLTIVCWIVTNKQFFSNSIIVVQVLCVCIIFLFECYEWPHPLFNILIVFFVGTKTWKKNKKMKKKRWKWNYYQPILMFDYFQDDL